MKFFFVLFFCFFWCQIKAKFTKHFYDFIVSNYGIKIANQFVRRDMGRFGSFGGRENESKLLINKPIIFVHGLTLRASIFLSHRLFFISKGYRESELYATTYSDGGITPFFAKDMKCEDIKQIRDFIKIVNHYTNSTVDIIAYSMGVAISRKAILGGICVDTGYNLGEKISRLVNVYVSLAGVAYGFEDCPERVKACNKINGMSCDSEYLIDINSADEPYEGAHSFGLYSKDDTLVGQKCCGNICSELKNAEKQIVVEEEEHISIFFATQNIQYDLIYNFTNVPSTRNFYRNKI